MNDDIGDGDRIASDQERSRLAVSAQVTELRLRLDRLERTIATGYVFVTAVLLIAGALLPIFVDEQSDGPDRAWSVVSTVGIGLSFLFGGDRHYSDSPGVDFAYLTGFVGLTLVIVLILLFVLPVAVSGQAGARRRRVSRIIVGLGVGGSVVPLLLSGLSIGAEGSEPGWGGVVLFAGMIASVVVVLGSFQTWKVDGTQRR